MLIPLARFKFAYRLIVQTSLRSQGCSVLIFVGPSIDAVAACSILTSLLKRDGVQYVIVAVRGYEDLEAKAAKATREHGNIRSVVLVSCGSIVDVEALLRLPENVSAFVIDHHRPVHPANINNARNVAVFADTESVPDPRPDYVPQHRQQQQQYDDEQQGEDVVDDDDRAPHPLPPEDWEVAGSDGGGGPSPPKRARQLFQDPDQQQQQQQQLHHQQFTADFASGSYYGSSCAFLAFELSAQESAETAHALWLAILGVTEHYIMHRCSTKQYIKQVEVLRQVAVTSLDKSLQFEPYEFHFILHRHWTLYDSMYHSPQVATRLAIWSEQGRKRLDQMLAKMGFPLMQCKEQYAMMSTDVKLALPEALAEYAPTFGLEDLTFPSFVKTLDNKLKMSAADCVYAMSALMELGPSGAAGSGDAAAAAVAMASVQGSWETNFWKAYDGLSSLVQWDLVFNGLSTAVALQKEIVREGADLLMKKVIVRNGPFRYGVLHDSPSLELFCHPHVLTRLALFLLDALRKPGKSSKPLVVAALNRRFDTYLVLGVTPSAPSTRSKRNDFGISFHQAAKLTEATVKFHAFDSSIIEIASRDLSRFLEILHSGLLDE